MVDSLVSVADVTGFLGITDTDQATTQATLLGNLITQCLAEFLFLTGRSAEKVTMANLLLQDGINCKINGSNLWLYGEYQDIISISALTEGGNELTESDTYGDDGDYLIDRKMGRLVRLKTVWSTLTNAIKITGYAGLGTMNDEDFTIRDDIKKIIIEMVAAASGLWKTIVITAAGGIETTRKTITDETMKKIERLKLKS